MRIVGFVLMAGAVLTIFVAPPAIQMSSAGFFWWGFVPGAIFAAGLGAIAAANS